MGTRAVRPGAAVVALLSVALPLVSAIAAGYGALSLVVFMGPPSGEVGDTVDVEVFVYYWSDLVDPTLLDATAGNPVNLTRVGVGHMAGAFTIPPGVASTLGRLTLEVVAELGPARARERIDYFAVADSSIARIDLDVEGWVTKASATGPQGSARDFLSGDEIVLHARSFYRGEPAFRAGVGPRLAWGDGTDEQQVPDPDFGIEQLPATHVGPGELDVRYTIPADLTASRRYGFTPYAAVQGAAFKFVAHPFPLTASVTRLGATDFEVVVLAGGETPAAGATFGVKGAAYDDEPDEYKLGPFSSVLDKDGRASFPFDVPVGGWAYLLLNVSWNGKLALLKTGVDNDLESLQAPSHVGFSAGVEGDTSIYGPGERATIRVVVLQDNQPVSNTPFSTIVSRLYHGELEAAAGQPAASNYTTDAQGGFALNYDIPLNWTPDQRLIVRVVGEADRSTTAEVVFMGWNSSTDWSPLIDIDLNGSRTDEPIHVVAVTGFNPAWESTIRVIHARARLVPAGEGDPVIYNIAGLLAEGGLTVQGASLAGDIDVPDWVPSGTYLCIVELTLGILGPYGYKEWFAVNTTSIHLEQHYTPPAPPPPSPPPPPFPTSVGAILIVAVLAALGVVALWRLRSRAPR